MTLIIENVNDVVKSLTTSAEVNYEREKDDGLLNTFIIIFLKHTPSRADRKTHDGKFH